MDSIGVGLQPKMNYHTSVGIYFVVYGIIGHFFVLNIIIAVFVEKYLVMRQKISNLKIFRIFNIKIKSLLS